MWITQYLLPDTVVPVRYVSKELTSKWVPLEFVTRHRLPREVVLPYYSRPLQVKVPIFMNCWEYGLLVHYTFWIFLRDNVLKIVSAKKHAPQLPVCVKGVFHKKINHLKMMIAINWFTGNHKILKTLLKKNTFRRKCHLPNHNSIASTIYKY